MPTLHCRTTLCLAVMAGLLLTPWATAEITGRAFLVEVPLPIQGTVDLRVKQSLDDILRVIPSTGPRATIVLEFNAEGQGEGSEFERSLALARYVAGSRLGRVRTVAYLRRPVHGHAVLVALACEQLVCHPDAELGDAGRGDSTLDVTMRSGYREIASRKRTVPVPVALAMLDASLTLFRVQTAGGVRYVLDEELRDLQQRGQILETETLVDAQHPAVFSGRDLRLEHGFASHLAENRQELATALGVATHDLETAWLALRPREPVLVDVDHVRRGPLRRVQRLVEKERQRRDVDWVCFRIANAGGAPVDMADLARYAVELSRQHVYTVAYIPEEGRADSALLALLCDRLIMHADAVLGGEGTVPLDRAELDAALDVVRELAQEKQKRWSLVAALVDPTRELARYTHQQTGARELFCDEELQQLPDHDLWTRDEIVKAAGEPLALTGERAEAWGVAKIVADQQSLAAMYDWQKPLESPEPSWADDFIAALATPRLGSILLFIAMFSLMAELSSPGVGVGGFISTICFLLFFWSNFLNGTAGWLEVLLFVTGIGCLALEVFVLPGFGIFGLGGGGLVILSLVLASQTFIIPHNRYELDQLPRSLWPIVFVMAGAIAGVATLRHYLHRVPGLSQILLDPPDPAGAGRSSFDHLLGQRGTASTCLAPSGKARIAGRLLDVTSEGEIVEAGQPVRVVAVAGYLVTVRPVIEMTPGDATPTLS